MEHVTDYETGGQRVMEHVRGKIKSLKQVFAVVRSNFLGFYKNPRIIITFLFSFILCFFLSSRCLMVADYYDSPIQAFEPFIWTFGDATSILLCSMLLILLFIDLPKLSPFTPLSAAANEKRQVAFGTVFLYLSSDCVVYNICIFDD